ncbi:aminotransferase [Rhodococcus sp. 15-725-2-2b]|uniref:aminotransferase class V-fold PLP-dependent enzyme n=1 Tax=unclassified Rhodococcus (in: high G+C Gram-positive bacteria) TaxID=192944 RepID=UPI000B9B7A50|nr:MULTISPECIES: aminotransferase class V-fold PLP-dependent enzyme [unclassified Rhodococcus (in: high G+C Gram-positive bacteria)]OZC72602.1 aminotransferase [Rhodococcus sp. 06-469-3-2]OZD48828.1 aminotransferase [Rhodococcus sp. 06-1477-1A]OZE77611.1 aminotransferase [Rhodococcus sp. 15-725-2-2b]
MLDHDRIRRDTPGASARVFLDSAGSSLPPTVVLDTAIAHLRREAEIGGYRAANERLDDLAAVKTSIATLIGAQASSIALSDSATRAWTDFFYSVPLSAGDRILLCQAEYASNAISALHRAEVTGATVEVMPSDASGRIDLDALESMLDDRVKLISVVHAPTNGGLINPARAVADLAHRHGALVLLDACQSIGQLRVDVEELGVDALSATGRKWLRGPRGTGFLYLRPGLASTLHPPALDLHSAEWTDGRTYRMADDATRFEFWECDVAARLALGAAVDYLLELGIDRVEDAVVERADYLRSGLRKVPGVTVRDLGDRKSGIVSFTVDGEDPVAVRDRLAERNVTVTVSHRGSTRLDMTGRGLDAVVRASPHYFVAFAELDAMLAALAGE